MTVVIEADPDDRYITIVVDGDQEEVVNEHQGIRFVVYDSDGVIVGRGTSRDELDMALGELRVIDERRGLAEDARKKAVAQRLADLVDRIVARGGTLRTAVRVVDRELLVADLPDDGSHPEPDNLDWRSEDDPEPGMTL